MLPRICNAVPVARKLTSINSGGLYFAVARMSGGYHPPPGWKPPHMDDMPVPCGSWEEENSRRQKKHNAHLVLGIGFLAFSLVVAKMSGLFFLNFYPPEKPSGHN